MSPLWRQKVGSIVAENSCKHSSLLSSVLPDPIWGRARAPGVALDVTARQAELSTCLVMQSPVGAGYTTGTDCSPTHKHLCGLLPCYGATSWSNSYRGLPLLRGPHKALQPRPHKEVSKPIASTRATQPFATDALTAPAPTAVQGKASKTAPGPHMRSVQRGAARHAPLAACCIKDLMQCIPLEEII